ncbi:MAG: tetratricopeptide repeat protein [Candidatus Magnetomorum sp.]|nr:tetratricopeptide repeat protein [Candidatus Magnetomorum sp.]
MLYTGLILFFILQLVNTLLEIFSLGINDQVIRCVNHSFFVFVLLLSIQAFRIYRSMNETQASFSPFALLLMYTIPFIILYGQSTLFSGITAEWFELRQMPVHYFLFGADVKCSQMICALGLSFFWIPLLFHHNEYHGIILSRIKYGSASVVFIVLLIVQTIFSYHLYPYNQQSIGRFMAASNIRQYAVDAFQKSLDIRPQNDRTHKMLGTTLVSQGQFDEGLRHFLKAIALNPVDLQTYINAGLVSIKQQNFFSAAQYFSQAVWLNPRNAEAHHYLGFVFSVQDRHDLAITQFRESLRLNPDDENVHFHLALVLCKQKKWQQALGHFQEALWINPNFVEAYVHLGNLLVHLGAVDKAFEAFKKALELKPNDPVIVQQMNAVTQTVFDFAKKLTSQKKFDQAITLYQGILKQRPDYSVSIHYNIACLYAQKNQVEEAVDWLKKAVNMGFKDWHWLEKDADFEKIRHAALFIKFVNTATGNQ